MSRPKLTRKARGIVGRDAHATHATRERYLDLLHARHARSQSDDGPEHNAWWLVLAGVAFTVAALMAAHA